MKRVAVVSVGRTDWSIWRPVLDEIRKDKTLKLHLCATGTHLSPEFGMTLREMQADGFEVHERIEVLLSSDSPQGIDKAIGLGVLGFAQAFDRMRPDILLVLGDRFETFAAVAAAIPFKIPVAHLHGGESTEGAMDELFRHAITKMSHIHFTSTPYYARKVRAMGEQAWRVFVTGAPGIDTLRNTKPLDPAAFLKKYGVDPKKPFLLATYHPVTLEFEDTTEQMRRFLRALERIDLPVLFTYPNADTAGRTIMGMLRDFEAAHPRSKVSVSMGRVGYASAMRYAAAMAGNSSSGIIESASFRLPVVNVGNRQNGRLKPRNVLDSGYEAKDIEARLRRALSPAFRKSLSGLKNPYGDGSAGRKIAGILRKINLGPKWIVKKLALN